MSDARCLACGGASTTRFAVRGYEVFRCAKCDLEAVHPVPSEAQLAALYAQGYFTGRGAGYADYFGRERAVAEDKARVRSALLREHGLRPEHGAVLELGCADGRFLLAMQSAGFAVQGVEPSDEARRELPESLRAHVHATLTPGRFAALCAFDVLEHLRDPYATLRALRPMLAPGALVAVVVPVIDNANARRWPSSWDQYKPPEHLHFFSRRALRNMLVDTLGAREVLCEQSAWTRPARLTDVALRGRAPAWLRRAEGALWRAGARRGWLAQEQLEDSVLLLARAGAP